MALYSLRDAFIQEHFWISPLAQEPKAQETETAEADQRCRPNWLDEEAQKISQGQWFPQESWAFGVGVLEGKFARLLFPEDAVCLLLVLSVSQARAECRHDPLSSLPYELGVPHACGFLYSDEGSSHSIPYTLVHCFGWTVTPFPPDQLVTKVQTAPDESQSYSSRCGIFLASQFSCPWRALNHSFTARIWSFCGRKHKYRKVKQAFIFGKLVTAR